MKCCMKACAIILKDSPNAHPMAILSAMINAMSCYEPEMMEIEDETTLERAAARIISRCARWRRPAKDVHRPTLMYPHPEFSYCNNFLHMMFSLLIGIMCRIEKSPAPFRCF